MAGSGARPAKVTGDTALGPGVLNQKMAASQFALARHEPSAAMAPFVDFYWILRWDLRGRPPHEQTILPHPNVNLAFEAAGSAVYGVTAAGGGHPSRAGRSVDWAVLAADLGYADQAHLTRDFTATIGVPPARYVTFATTAPQIPETKP
jgi:AraC-like DNA-binding protein